MAIRFVLHLIFLLWLTKSLALAGSLAKPRCAEKCGNISIPYPFGIGVNCYLDEGFAVTCNSSFTPHKPFLSSINMELLNVTLDSPTVLVNNPVITSNCPNRRNSSGSIDLVGSPFNFSDNLFVAVGCDGHVLLKQQDKVIGGCASLCDASAINANGSCYGVNCCQATIPPFLKFINATLTSVDPQNDRERCSSAFMVDQTWFNLTNPSALLNMDYVPALLEWRITNHGTCDYPSNGICTTDAGCDSYDGLGYYCYCGYSDDAGNPYLPDGCQGSCSNGRMSNGTCFPDRNEVIILGSLAKPRCEEKCGNIRIPYPFGIGVNCYLDEGFAVTCNSSFTPHKPFLSSINMELLNVTLGYFPTVLVNNPVITSNCQSRRNSSGRIDLVGSPFIFSRNIFVAVGCDNLVLLNHQDMEIGGCESLCNASVINTNGSCDGVNCCQTTFPRSFKFINAILTSVDPQNDKEGCSSAFVVDQNWFKLTNSSALLHMDYVPALLRWGIINHRTSNICGTGASYDSFDSLGYFCYCGSDHAGNPYLPDGCQGSCSNGRMSNGTCVCSIGYILVNGTCVCPIGYTFFNGTCSPDRNETESSGAKVIILGISSGVGLLFALLIGSWWLYKIVKRRKKVMRKQKFFKRNGGLLLQQQLSSIEGNVERAKLFTSKELEKATDGYNENRILGQGGQGTVYKGMLVDGRIVAVKKSKIVDERNLEQFINEVVILSQINHRNVVKLLGCCLETEVPLLVYEFIPNGTLSQYIHGQNEDFPLTWEMRLRIATEAAGALFYLHSAASVPIYHRDIKSTNILLDDKYRAKISDFGTSRSLAIDQTHLTTRVLGTFGYLDPEFFQSSQFTEKSDVYSFGVVLVELLTGEKAISSIRSREERSLATHFLLTMEENRVSEILDTRIFKESEKEEIIAVAMVAKRCLNLNGKKRPTMKEVTVELEGIQMSGRASNVQQNSEGYDYPAAEVIETYWGGTSTSISTALCLGNSAPVSLDDVQPFLLNE